MGFVMTLKAGHSELDENSPVLVCWIAMEASTKWAAVATQKCRFITIKNHPAIEQTKVNDKFECQVEIYHYTTNF